MKTVLTVLALVLFFSPQASWARKPCEELKSEIAARLDAKGVSGYQLDIVAKDAQDERKTVGSCNGGDDRIVYTRSRPVPADAAVAKR